MKEWFRYFKIWFLVCGILLVVMCMIFIPDRLKAADSENAVRVNNVCTETERVFDYADVLTDQEEQDLRDLIARREQQTQCDIVLVIMNRSLEDYAKAYDANAYGSDWAMIMADNFYDENGFGWNKYQESDDGDGVLLLDNWYRESDGKVHTWFSTSGKAMERYSNAMIEGVLDAVYACDIETEPYKAYRAYVEQFYYDMTGQEDLSIPWMAVFILPAIVAVVFVLMNLSGKEGAKTTRVDTYVGGVGSPLFPVREDRFIRKSVTKRHIERSSGSSGGGGGGGTHISSGGHSHGGGGRSR